MNLFLLFITIVSSIMFKITSNLIYTMPIIGITLILCYKKKHYLSLGYISIYLIIFLIPISEPIMLENHVEDYKITIISKEKTYYIVKDENDIKYLLYLDEDIEEGSILKVNGEIKRLKNTTVPLVFNFASYLKNQGVKGQFYINDYEVIYYNYPFRVEFIDNLVSNLSIKSASFIKLLIFGEKSILTDSIYNNLIDVSAVHLFVVSGFHFNIFKLMLTNLLSRFFKGEKIIEGIIIVILFFYLYLLDFAISAFRSFLFIFLRYLNRLLFNSHFHRVELLSLTGILMVLINPLVVISPSFLLCFIVSFVIEFSNKLKLPFKKILIPFILHLSTLPIILDFNYEYNLVSIIATPLLTLPTTIFFFLSLIVMIFPFLDFIYLRCLIGFEELIRLINQIPLKLIFGKPDVFFPTIFYLILLTSILLFSLNIKKKALINLFLIIPLLVCQYFSTSLIIYDEVHFIDVGQGDCILIKKAFNQVNILIDTGGNKSFDLATNRLIPYFKALNIKKLDALIISHDDFDHMGAASSLLSNFNVDKVIKGNDFEYLKFNGLTLYNLNYQISCDNDNDCSNVIYTNINGIYYLFSGDISSNIEQEIIKKNPILKCDVLKVSHHGSNTSTSEEFINHIKPRFAIIQVGTNYYGHPHNEVLKRLDNYNVITLTTRNQGSIIFKMFNKKLMISLTPP